MPCRGCGKKGRTVNGDAPEDLIGEWQFELRGPRGRLHLKGGMEEFEQDLLDALHPDALPDGAQTVGYILTWQFVETKASD